MGASVSACTILLAEDEIETAAEIKLGLEQNGYLLGFHSRCGGYRTKAWRFLVDP
jgi:hypothetical protein